MAILSLTARRQRRLDRAAVAAEWSVERPRGVRRALAFLREVGELHEERAASHSRPAPAPP